MRESLRKAVEIDSCSQDGLTSSMADDIFFVLQKCTRSVHCLRWSRRTRAVCVHTHTHTLTHVYTHAHSHIHAHIHKHCVCANMVKGQRSIAVDLPLTAGMSLLIRMPIHRGNHTLPSTDNPLPVLGTFE